MLILHKSSQITIHTLTVLHIVHCRCESMEPWQILLPSRAAHVGRLCKALGILKVTITESVGISWNLFESCYSTIC